MHTSKLVFMVMIGLAMFEFSAGEPLNAAPPTDTVAPLIAVSQGSSQDVAEFPKSNKLMRGVASFYADIFHGQKTASGQVFQQDNLTAAHRSLPLGTKVRVTNLHNRKSVEVEINDRGPWRKGRIIDVSKAAARQLGMIRTGRAFVQLEVIQGLSSGKS